MSSRSVARVTRRPPLCGGCAAGMNRTRSRSSASAASVASHRWPTWGGSKVPPRTPRLTGNRSARVLGTGAAPCGRPAVRCSLVVAPLELGRADVDGRAGFPRPWRRSSTSIPSRSSMRQKRSRDSGFSKSVRAAAVSIRRPRTRRSSPSATTSHPSASGSKRWTRISSSAGWVASRGGRVGQCRDQRSAQRLEPGAVVGAHADRLDAVGAKRIAQLRPALARPPAGRAW